MTLLDRRTLLIGSGALALAACAKSGTRTSTTAAAPFTLAARFESSVIVPGTPRLPFSIASDSALLSDGPDVLRGQIRDADGAVVIPAISAVKRRVTDALCYWDFHPALTEIGIYYLVVDGATTEGAAFQINDPAQVEVPYVGTALAPFDTPTTADARGVDPICTRLAGGPCPFHTMTLTEALASGRPVAYMIGTPAHCQFATCAPGLEFLITASQRLGDALTIVHAEVYVDDTATIAAPAVDAYHLSFEPTLFLADATGTIIERLDAAWDQSELDENLARLVT